MEGEEEGHSGIEIFLLFLWIHVHIEDILVVGKLEARVK